jgi:hypothetical protein
MEARLAPRLDASARMVLRHLVRRPLRAVMSVAGIAIAVAVLMFGLLFIDVIDQLIVMQFFTIERQHATVTFAQPRSRGRFLVWRVYPACWPSSPSGWSPPGCVPVTASAPWPSRASAARAL